MVASELPVGIVSLGTVARHQDEFPLHIRVSIVVVLERRRGNAVPRKVGRALELPAQRKGNGCEVAARLQNAPPTRLARGAGRPPCHLQGICGAQPHPGDERELLKVAPLVTQRRQIPPRELFRNVARRLLRARAAGKSSFQLIGSQIPDVRHQSFGGNGAGGRSRHEGTEMPVADRHQNGRHQQNGPNETVFSVE